MTGTGTWAPILMLALPVFVFTESEYGVLLTFLSFWYFASTTSTFSGTIGKDGRGAGSARGGPACGGAGGGPTGGCCAPTGAQSVSVRLAATAAFQMAFMAFTFVRM